jgi:hypothetical protein
MGNSKWESNAARERILEIRRELCRMGYSADHRRGKVPGFDRVELWATGPNFERVIWLAWNWNGRWNVIAPVCHEADADAVLEAVKHFSMDVAI